MRAFKDEDSAYFRLIEFENSYLGPQRTGHGDISVLDFQVKIALVLTWFVL